MGNLHNDEKYDAKEAYNKDLTASARLHYLENDRHDHESPAHRHTRSHRLRERAMRISERSGAERGDAYDYEDPKVQKLLAKANELDERSNKKTKKEEDSPLNEIDRMGQRIINQSMKSMQASLAGNDRKAERHHQRALRMAERDDRRKAKENANIEITTAEIPEVQASSIAYDPIKGLHDPADDSPLKAAGEGCAKSEGGSGCVKERGGEWVILNNKKGGIWRSGFSSKAAANDNLAGYHANS